ncbi:MAG: hypothetical protein A2Y76_00380 [Planctomycetes bacterium RBG_13_60_9]|nr:MAG: hypothetical protein A2Y76_00380 [Planctomycetes bacterium RBG_13_60_9]
MIMWGKICTVAATAAAGVPTTRTGAMPSLGGSAGGRSGNEQTSLPNLSDGHACEAALDLHSLELLPENTRMSLNRLTLASVDASAQTQE